jgi:hypothetical protein
MPKAGRARVPSGLVAGKCVGFQPDGSSGGYGGRGALVQDRDAERLHRLVEAGDDLGLREEADDLDGLGAGVDETVRDHGGDDGEVARREASALVADLGLRLAGDQVEDLLCAVGVAGESVARLDLEVVSISMLLS